MLGGRGCLICFAALDVHYPNISPYQSCFFMCMCQNHLASCHKLDAMKAPIGTSALPIDHLDFTFLFAPISREDEPLTKADGVQERGMVPQFHQWKDGCGPGNFNGIKGLKGISSKGEQPSRVEMLRQLSLAVFLGFSKNAVYSEMITSDHNFQQDRNYKLVSEALQGVSSVKSYFQCFRNLFLNMPQAASWCSYSLTALLLQISIGFPPK